MTIEQEIETISKDATGKAIKIKIEQDGVPSGGSDWDIVIVYEKE